MQICAKRAEAAKGLAFPSQSGSKHHKAYAWREGAAELNGCFCSCQAFIFGRSKVAKTEGSSPQEVTFVCKHLQQIFDNYCGWRQQTENDYRYDRTCPKCGGDVIDTDDNLIPDNPDDAVDDLRAMLAEMNGEEAPAPVERAPQTRPFTVEFTMQTTYRGVVNALNEEEARSMHGDLYGSPDAEEIACQCTDSKATEGVPEVKPVKRVRKKAEAAPKPDTAKAKAAAKTLAATIAPRKRSA